MEYIIAVTFIYLFGLMILNGQLINMGIGDKPHAYNSQVIMGILGIAVILFFVLFAVMLFVNWKFTLWLTLGTVLTSFIHLRISKFIFEKTIVEPMYNWADKKNS